MFHWCVHNTSNYDWHSLAFHLVCSQSHVIEGTRWWDLFSKKKISVFLLSNLCGQQNNWNLWLHTEYIFISAACRSINSNSIQLSNPKNQLTSNIFFFFDFSSITRTRRDSVELEEKKLINISLELIISNFYELHDDNQRRVIIFKSN